ncbi:MAG TPA: tetratricopeptide repeat protein, partial [Pyrinomonadaceae bacterium]
MPVARFYLGTPLRHVVGTASLVAVIAGAATVILWSFANTLARNSDTLQASQFAAALSPSDPRARYAYANDLEKTFDLDAIDRSLVEYEEAAALTPHNFLYWLALGQARERAGERPAAETAYRRALELAPNYGVAKWSLGNSLLRQGKVKEGIDLIRGAVEKDPSLAAPAVVAAMQVFDGD